MREEGWTEGKQSDSQSGERKGRGKEKYRDGGTDEIITLEAQGKEKEDQQRERMKGEKGGPGL